MLVCGQILQTEYESTSERYMLMSDDSGHIQLTDLLQPQPIFRVTAIDVLLYLYTKNNPITAENISANNFTSLLESANFDSSKKIFFIIHGWHNSYRSNVNTFITEALLLKYDLNVFVVDWSEAASAFYVTSKNAVPIVGEIVGDFINQMVTDLGMSYSNIYLAGHSLGAHVCGAVGARTKGKVKSIVGMDPALLLFNVANLNYRLDKSDAAFVHVIHTNGGKLGFSTPIGHADYYPNGGENQAGCYLDMLGKCSHRRSYMLYAESLISNQFRAVSCDSYSSFRNGLCYNNPASYLGQLDVDTRLVT